MTDSFKDSQNTNPKDKFSHSTSIVRWELGEKRMPAENYDYTSQEVFSIVKTSTEGEKVNIAVVDQSDNDRNSLKLIGTESEDQSSPVRSS